MPETTGPGDGGRTDGWTGSDRGRFGRGRDPLERTKKPATETPPRVEVEGTGLLGDYRFVWENDAAHDDTPKRKTLRKLLLDDPRGFVKDLKELEKAELVGGGSAKAAVGVEPGASIPPPTPDPGTRRLVGLIDKLLAQAVRESRG